MKQSISSPPAGSFYRPADKARLSNVGLATPVGGPSFAVSPIRPVSQSLTSAKVSPPPKSAPPPISSKVSPPPKSAANAGVKDTLYLKTSSSKGNKNICFRCKDGDCKGYQYCIFDSNVFPSGM